MIASRSSLSTCYLIKRLWVLLVFAPPVPVFVLHSQQAHPEKTQFDVAEVKNVTAWLNTALRNASRYENFLARLEALERIGPYRGYQ